MVFINCDLAHSLPGGKWDLEKPGDGSNVFIMHLVKSRKMLRNGSMG